MIVDTHPIAIFCEVSFLGQFQNNSFPPVQIVTETFYDQIRYNIVHKSPTESEGTNALAQWGITNKLERRCFDGILTIGDL